MRGRREAGGSARGQDVGVVMPLTGAEIEAQTGAAQGLWTHTPLDYGGNEGVAKPAVFPANASQGYLGQGGGTRPGGAVTQTPSPPGAPKIPSTQITNVTTTASAWRSSSTPSATSSRLNYGTTQAVATTHVGYGRGGADDQRLTGLTTGTLYHFERAATNARHVSSAT